jgi:hypothetical protein
VHRRALRAVLVGAAGADGRALAMRRERPGSRQQDPRPIRRIRPRLQRVRVDDDRLVVESPKRMPRTSPPRMERKAAGVVDVDEGVGVDAEVDDRRVAAGKTRQTPRPRVLRAKDEMAKRRRAQTVLPARRHISKSFP